MSFPDLPNPSTRLPHLPVLPLLPFFVYGTLRPGEDNHARHLLGRTLTEEPALLTGAVLYDGPGYPYAVEVPGGRVVGELVTVPGPLHPTLLAALDVLEEYRSDDPDSLYLRVVRDVVRERDGGVVSAWVYVASPRVAARLLDCGELVPGGDWRTRPDAPFTRSHPLPHLFRHPSPPAP